MLSLSQINIYYACLIKSLENYLPTFYGSYIEFTCPSLIKEELPFKAKIIILYSCDGKKTYSIKIMNSECNKNIMNLTEDVIIKKELWDKFNSIVANGFLQTVNLLCTKYKFNTFQFPCDKRNAEFIVNHSNLSSMYYLNKFRFVKTNNISFKSLLSNKIITVKRKNLINYFNELTQVLISFGDIQSNNKISDKVFNTFFTSMLPENDNLEVTSEDSNSVFYYKKNKLTLKKISYSQFNYHTMSDYLNRTAVFFKIFYENKNFDTVENAMEYIDSLEILSDCLDEKQIICTTNNDNNNNNIISTTCNNGNCISCHLIKFIQIRNKQRKLNKVLLHNDLNYYFHKKTYSNALEQIKILGDNSSDIIEYTKKIKNTLSQVLINNLNLLKYYGFINFILSFNDELSYNDLKYLEFLISKNVCNYLLNKLCNKII